MCYKSLAGTLIGALRIHRNWIITNIRDGNRLKEGHPSPLQKKKGRGKTWRGKENVQENFSSSTRLLYCSLGFKADQEAQNPSVLTAVAGLKGNCPERFFLVLVL